MEPGASQTPCKHCFSDHIDIEEVIRLARLQGMSTIRIVRSLSGSVPLITMDATKALRANGIYMPSHKTPKPTLASRPCLINRALTR